MGKLYKALHNIEMARQNAVRNAKAANLPASDDMSLLALSDLYRYQNNTEDIEIDSESSQNEYFELWEEPEGWPDIKTILSEAEDIVVSNIIYKPWIAMVLDARIEITKQFYTYQQGNYKYKTSDGQILDGTISSITWDTSKDIHCSDGMVVRYVIVYKRESEIAYSNSMYYAKFHQWPVLHVVYGPWGFEHPGVYQISNISSTTTRCENIKVIDCLPGCEFNGLGGDYSTCKSLRKLCLRFKPGYIMGTWNNTGSYYQPLYGLTGLQELELHNVVKCGTIGVSNDSYHGPFGANMNCLKRVDLPDYEEGFINIKCGNMTNKKPPKDLIVNIPKLKKSKYLPVVFNYNKKEFLNDTIEHLHCGLFSVSSASYNIGLETIKLMALKHLRLTSASIIGVIPNLKSAYFPVLETLEMNKSTSSTLFDTCDPNNLYVSMPSMLDFVAPKNLTNTRRLTLDMPAVTNIDIYGFTYNGSSMYPYAIILAPCLETMKLETWSDSSSSLYGTIEIKHNNPIDFTLSKLTTSLEIGDSYGYLIADEINTLTIESTTNIYNVCHLLLKSKFKRLVCTFSDYKNTSTKDISVTQSSDTNIRYTEPLLRENVELDFGTGSALDKDMGKWMNDEDFTKLFTNLITLPEGETRTLILGDNLTKLSEETKAIATNKGWVLN